MAALTTNTVPRAGLQADDKLVAADAAGDDCATGRGVFLIANNGSAGPLDVVLATPGVIDGDLNIEERTVSVPAGGESIIPVTNRYRDPGTGRGTITYPGGVTSLSVAVFAVQVA